MKKCIALFVALFVSFNLFTPLGLTKAIKGGTFKYNLGQQPTTMNPLSSTDYYSSIVQSYVIETLLERNVDTYDWGPSIATKWKTAKDGLSYTFTIREGVKWHDGKPLTVEDIKFSFDAIVDPTNKYKTAHQKPYFENIKEAKIIDKNTIKFSVKKRYFKNFDVVAGLAIIPKHLYENPSKKLQKKLNKTLVGTGPYIFEKFKRGKNIILRANENWWGRSISSHKKQKNFGKILMRFIKDGTIAIQRAERGDLDFISLSSEEYVKKTSGKKWGKSVFKTKAQNKKPKSYGFIAWNIKKDLFKTRNTRLALYHLLDREKMIKKFRYGYSLPATGPWYQQSQYANPKVKPVLYNPKKALSLLRKEGWKDTDGDKILDKVINGKKVQFSFTILEPNKEFVKYLTVYKEDAKAAGIDVNIKYVEWNTFIKLLDERKFEAVRLAWSGGSVDLDPKQIWHSESSKAGSNYISYSNKKVDSLIDKARDETNKAKRVTMLREVYKLIAYDVPYAFLFNDKFTFYGYTKRMGQVKDTYQYGVGLDYWWIKK